MIEILVGLVILSFGLLPIYNLFKQGRDETVNNVQETIATNYASDVINFCKEIRYSDLKKAVEEEGGLDSDKTFTFYDEGNDTAHKPTSNAASLQKFFEENENLKFIAPTLIEEKAYNRILKIKDCGREKKTGLAGLWQSIKDFFSKTCYVSAYLATVTVSFPRNQNKKIEDKVILYTLILD